MKRIALFLWAFGVVGLISGMAAAQPGQGRGSGQIPSEDTPGFQLRELRLPALEEKAGETGIVPAAKSVGIAERTDESIIDELRSLPFFLMRADLAKGGQRSVRELLRIGEGDKKSDVVGARELRLMRWKERLGNHLAKNRDHWLKVMDSDAIEAVVQARVVDVQMLNRVDYGAEVTLEVDQYLKKPTRLPATETIRVRKGTGRLACGDGDEARVWVSHEVRTQIGEQGIYTLTLFPWTLWQAASFSPCESHMDWWYRTELTEEIGFYEFQDVGLGPIIEEGLIFDRGTQEPRPVEDIISEIRQAMP